MNLEEIDEVEADEKNRQVDIHMSYLGEHYRAPTKLGWVCHMANLSPMPPTVSIYDLGDSHDRQTEHRQRSGHRRLNLDVSEKIAHYVIPGSAELKARVHQRALLLHL